MPNQFESPDQLNQNGSYSKAQKLPDELVDSVSLNKITVLSETTSSKHLDNDWSNLTQELLDTLPRVWARGLLYFLFVFVAIVLPWAMLSKVDETGSARGRLEPKGATQRLDASANGTVAHVRVTEGQIVKAGQIIMELESNVLRTDIERAKTKLEGQLNRLSQLEVIKNQLAIATRAQELQNQAQELEKQAQIEQARQNLSANKVARTLAENRFAKDTVEVQRYRKLWEQDVTPEIKVVEMERAAEESKRLLAAALAEIEQANSRLTEQQNSYQSLIQAGKLAVLKSEQQLKDLQTQVTSLQAEISQTKSEIKSLEIQLEQRTFRAPTDGTIFQLPIQRPGTVVQPGQIVAQIAPKGSVLIFKAQMPIPESGFMRPGMPVKLKFDAYPFQDYGVVPARVLKISPDSKPMQTQQGQIEMFELEIDLNNTYIQSQDKQIALVPGQTATAEVIVRQRRLIDFVLDPFKKLREGGLKL
jgi:hemolysin D